MASKNNTNAMIKLLKTDQESIINKKCESISQRIKKIKEEDSILFSEFIDTLPAQIKVGKHVLKPKDKTRYEKDPYHWRQLFDIQNPKMDALQEEKIKLTEKIAEIHFSVQNEIKEIERMLIFKNSDEDVIKRINDLFDK